jgi:hypothetical protein
MQLKPLRKGAHPFDTTFRRGTVERVSKLVSPTVTKIKILMGLVYDAIGWITKQKILLYSRQLHAPLHSSPGASISRSRSAARIASSPACAVCFQVADEKGHRE